MIIILPVELFEGADTHDLALSNIFAAGQKRYKVRLRPSYRPGKLKSFEAWLARQSPRIQEQIREVLDRGLTELEFMIPGGEPSIRVERRDSPEWPDNFTSGPVKLPISIVADFITQPLQLILENGRNDWGFLHKVVPPDWRNAWKQAVDSRWVISQGGGLDELTQTIRTQIALEHAYRLRTWVMFDSDGRVRGHLTGAARKARDACMAWNIVHHVLERRAIENYIPKATLFDLAARRAVDEKIQLPYRRYIHACIEAYVAMNDEQRHHYNLADGFKADANSREKLDEATEKRLKELYDVSLKAQSSPLYMGLGGNPAQDIWGDDPDKTPFEISEEAIKSVNFEIERAEIFQSIFAML